MLIRRLLVLALSSLVFAVALPAQEKDPRPTDPRAEQSDEDRELEKQKLERLEQLGRDEKRAAEEAGNEIKGADKPPEKLPGLERHVSTVAAVKPHRIGPGGSGTLHLILAMVDTAVLQVGGQLEILYPGQTGPITLGAWTLDPASRGSLPTRFRGQPVYDNTAIVRIPIQVAPTAEYGDYAIGLSVTAEVTDGETGQVRGKFYGSTRASIVIGDPLPTPTTVGQPSDGDAIGAEQPAHATSWQPGDAVRSSGAANPNPPPGSTGRALAPEQPAQQATTDGAGPGAMPTLDDRGSRVSWLWIVGGLLAAGLGALGVAAARRR